MNAVVPLPLSSRGATPGAVPHARSIRPSQAVNGGLYASVGVFVIAMIWAWIVTAGWGGFGQLFLVAAAGSLLYAGWQWLELRCISYRIDADRIVWSAGIVSKTTGSLEIFRIQNITLHQGVFERIFAAGSLVLQTQDPTNPLVRMIGVADPEEFREALTAYVQQLRRARGMQEVFVN